MGIFTRHGDADKALLRLRKEGIEVKEISVIVRQDIVSSYRSPKNESEGILTGSVLGGLAGLLIGLTPVILPGIGAVLVVGPLTMLTTTLMGVLAGGLIGTLVEIGVPERSAKIFEKSIKKGGVLLAVTANYKNEKQVRQILDMHDVKDLTIIPSARKVSGQLLEQQISVAYPSRIAKPVRRKE